MQQKQINLTDAVMSQIQTEKITMKPRWFFVIGSLATVMGLVGVLILSTFLVSLISFSLRTHGPMGAIRYQQLLDSFPWWSLLVIVLGIGMGVLLLKQYDFSYKKNFGTILVGILIAIIVSGWLIDYTGLDNIWMRRGPMRMMYQQYGGSQRFQNPGIMRGPGWRWQNP